MLVAYHVKQEIMKTGLEEKGCVINLCKKENEFKETEKSHFINCIFKLKKGGQDTLFNHYEGESFIVKLDGYAIIPIEEYNKLTKDSIFKKITKYIKRKICGCH